MRTGIQLIEDERERQEIDEGWTAEHDDGHTNQELAKAASCYANPWPTVISPGGIEIRVERDFRWPFNIEWWKPEVHQYVDTTTDEYIDGRIRELQKAGALIAAEIDRWQRIKEKNNE